MNAQKIIQKHKLLECIQCGVCTGSCPVARKANINIRKYMRETAHSSQISTLSRNELWSCTTCAACGLRCPKDIDPYEFLIDIRSLAVEDGRIEPTIRNALEAIFNHGNPWGRLRNQRSDWTEGLTIKHISQGSKTLYFVGCTPAYDPRGQEAAKSFVKCFKKARVEFGILGNEEPCCGSEVYGMGEKGLFDLLVEENTKIFTKYAVERIVVTCPHAYHTFKNRYNQITCEVLHHTQLLADLLENRQLSFSRGEPTKVIYHDPCFLGKQNGIYEEPRRIIENIPGVKLLEFDRSRSRSLCCEGGGGRMWVDVPGERLAELRVREAVESGADILAVACPFCLSTFEDAVKTTGCDGKIRVMEIAELVSQAL